MIGSSEHQNTTHFLDLSVFILKSSWIFLHKSLIECQVCVPTCWFVNFKTEIGYSTSSHQNTTDLTQYVWFYLEDCEDSIFQSVCMKC